MKTRDQIFFDAGIESIKHRQSLSPTGGIVESDPRVDRGNYLYENRCWARNYHIEPLLAAGEINAVLKNLNYWKLVFEKSDGFFRHNSHFQTGESMSKQVQIDNNAHFIHHIFLTFEMIGDGDWLVDKLPIVIACADYLCSRLDEKEGLLLGQEERVVEEIAFPICFSFYINRVCVSALQRASVICDGKVGQELCNKWNDIANLVAENIRTKFWDQENECYAYLIFDPKAEHDKAGKLSTDQSWGTLWAYIHNYEYTEKDKMSVHKRLNALWKIDHLLPKIICQKEPNKIFTLLEIGDDKEEFRYSGVGVCPAANAIGAWIMAELENNDLLANELWEPLAEVMGDKNLLPEHINTMHPGRMKDYTLWPDKKSFVDSGNLMHLSMYLTAMVRIKKLRDF